MTGTAFLKLWGVWLLLQLAALCFFLLDYQTIAAGPQLCVAKNLGFESCWGCGTTRCMWLIAHGEWSSAWQLNKLSFLTFGLFVLLDIQCFLKLRRRHLSISSAAKR